MARYKISGEIEGSRIDAVRKALAATFKIADPEATFSVSLIEKKVPSRAERFAEAQALIGEAKSIVEELKDEVGEWFDNLPEGFQASEKGSALEEARDALEEIEGNLDEAESADIDFPGMY